MFTALLPRNGLHNHVVLLLRVDPCLRSRSLAMRWSNPLQYLASFNPRWCRLHFESSSIWFNPLWRPYMKRCGICAVTYFNVIRSRRYKMKIDHLQYSQVHYTFTDVVSQRLETTIFRNGTPIIWNSKQNNLFSLFSSNGLRVWRPGIDSRQGQNIYLLFK
jgi:hypothetical protein